MIGVHFNGICTAGYNFGVVSLEVKVVALFVIIRNSLVLFFEFPEVFRIWKHLCIHAFRKFTDDQVFIIIGHCRVIFVFSNAIKVIICREQVWWTWIPFDQFPERLTGLPQIFQLITVDDPHIVKRFFGFFVGGFNGWIGKGDICQVVLARHFSISWASQVFIGCYHIGFGTCTGWGCDHGFNCSLPVIFKFTIAPTCTEFPVAKVPGGIVIEVPFYTCPCSHGLTHGISQCSFVVELAV